MHPHRSHAAAFTLVELLVSMALGLMIVAIAFAGFRAATQTMAVANRLSLQNGLMRQGIFAAMDEADTWRAMDDPECDPAVDPADANAYKGQALRRSLLGAGNLPPAWPGATPPGNARISRQLGMVFTPFNRLSSIQEIGVGSPKLFDRTAPQPVLAGISPREGERGFDPSSRWDAADERTWYWGLPFYDGPGGDDSGEWGETADIRWGRYGGLFTGAAADPGDLGETDHDDGDTTDSTAYTQIFNMVAGGDPQLTDMAPPAFRSSTGVFTAHTWRDAQVLALFYALGRYGWMEYLPRNSIYAAYGSGLPDVEEGTELDDLEEVVNTYRWAGGRPNLALMGMCVEQRWALSLAPFLLEEHPIIVWAPTASPYGSATFSTTVPPTSTWSQTKRADGHYQFAMGAYSYNDSNASDKIDMYKTVLEQSTITRPVMLRRPADWPEATYATSRWLSGARAISTSRIRVVEPKTGEVYELSFNNACTTLRGARQQRKQPPTGTVPGTAVGWARWSSPVDRDLHLDD